jgi:hypothetical protein
MTFLASTFGNVLHNLGILSWGMWIIASTRQKINAITSNRGITFAMILPLNHGIK